MLVESQAETSEELELQSSLEVSSDSSDEVEIEHLINTFGFGMYQVRLLMITGENCSQLFLVVRNTVVLSSFSPSLLFTQSLADSF